MRIAPPKSAFATMSDLVLAVAQLEQQPEPLIEQFIQQRLIQAAAGLRAAVEALDQARTAKRHAASARREQGGLMIRSVRDFHQNLRRLAKRNPAALIWLETFNLKQALPAFSSLNASWYEQARQIAEAGESSSAKLAADPLAFQVPMPSSPSASEVAGALASALTAQHSYTHACVALKQAEAVARVASEQGRRLLALLRKRLACLFHELSPEMRRVEMVKYGVHYVRSRATVKANDAPAQVVESDPIPARKPIMTKRTVRLRRATAPAPLQGPRQVPTTPGRSALAGCGVSTRDSPDEVDSYQERGLSSVEGPIQILAGVDTGGLNLGKPVKMSDDRATQSSS